MKKKFCIKSELELIVLLSHAGSDYDKLIILLKIEFGFTLTKLQLAEVLGISTQTVDRRIAESMNIPSYLRSSDGKKASYYWPIFSVAKHLLDDTVEIY